MFNPLCLFTTQLLEAFVKNKKKYFVRQAYHFRNGETGKEFIFSHYQEHSFALHHMGAIEEDPYRYVYEWDHPEHQKKLYLAASQPETYKIWSAVFRKDWEKEITKDVEACVRKYVHSLGWRPTRNDMIKPEFYMYYGNLYIQLKFKTKTVRVRFEEVQNLV
jgi:hypothetical protein